jgi:sodium-coupled neutral amino acid transporter 9
MSILPDEALVSHLNDTVPTSFFHKIWVEERTVPFFLIIMLGPIVNFRSPTFFTKFNALGKYHRLQCFTVMFILMNKYSA